MESACSAWNQSQNANVLKKKRLTISVKLFQSYQGQIKLCQVFASSPLSESNLILAEFVSEQGALGCHVWLVPSMPGEEQE